MFGYTTPLICELKVGEHNFYKSVYCGLCRTLKKNYSNWSTILLNYDLVFFAIFSMNFFDDKIEFEKKFCPIHPFKKRTCLKQCKSLEIAADLTILFSHFRFIDHIHDERTLKKITARIILIFMKKHFKKASQNQQKFTKIIQNFMKKQTQIEKSNKTSIDAACHPTAKCLEQIFEDLTPNKNEAQNLKKFGYFLGRFIYLIDALDDLENDFKLNNFNPFLISKLKTNFEKSTQLPSSTKNELFEKAFYSINLTLAQLAQTYSKINLQKLKPIVDNIILLGLMASHKRVFEKRQQLELFNQLKNRDKFTKNL